jgi:iron complex transport system permease protein
MIEAAAVANPPAPRIGSLRAAQRRSRRLFLLVLAGLLLLASLAALAIGPVPIALSDILSALWPGGLHGPNDQAAEIIRAIRLPRLILGLCVGGALGVCGAALQGLFRNPLADPGIIGISSGAALAAALIIVSGHALAPQLLAWAGPYALPAGAFIGSGAAILSVHALSRKAGVTSGSSLILAGIAINALVSAALGYLSFVSTDEQLRQLTFWTLGSLGRIDWASLIPAALAMLVSSLLMLRLAPVLNIYLLGEREAGHLGVDVERLKKEVIALVALGVGAAVAVSGIIGFVGLAAPHIIRLFVGADHRVVLPGSALLGALLLVCGDLVARTAVAPAELPIGVLTSALGGPLFLWLLSRYRREFL